MESLGPLCRALSMLETRGSPFALSASLLDPLLQVILKIIIGKIISSFSLKPFLGK